MAKKFSKELVAKTIIENSKDIIQYLMTVKREEMESSTLEETLRIVVSLMVGSIIGDLDIHDQANAYIDSVMKEREEQEEQEVEEGGVDA